MTSSIENALKSFTLLKEGLDEHGCPRLSHLADVVGKCVRSLTGQVAHYEAQKAAAPGNTAAAVLRSSRFSGALTVYGEKTALDRAKNLLRQQEVDLWLL
jgi:hypothetical protein